MEHIAVEDRFLDIDEVIRKKNPKLLKIIPRFLINILKRIVHQDDLNQIIYTNRDNYGVAFVNGSLRGFETKYEVEGFDTIPVNGRYTFASNHPLGGLDGLVLMEVIDTKFSDIKFIVNDLLSNVKNLEPVFIPVNKHGKQSIEYARKIEEAYKSDTQILTFPAGLCSRKIKGKITDLEWHKNFVVKSVRYKRDIVPIYIEARNTNFFYNLSRIRKFLGIKANLEMLFLVDEMFKQQKKKIKITFGSPIPYMTFDNSKTPKEWTTYVRTIVYSMQKTV